MFQFVCRTVGFVVITTLSVIGASSVCRTVMAWKHSHDKQSTNLRTTG